MAKKKSSDSTKKDATLKQKALGPAAENFGQAIAPLGTKAGETVTAVGNLLLNTVSGLVYGVEAVANWLLEAVSARLKETPKDKIVAPNPRIAVPAVQALTYSMNEEIIREMFANLLAADMNANLKGKAHPAFVELIKEMTPLDAKILWVLREQGPQMILEGNLVDSKSHSRGVGDGLSFAIVGASLDTSRQAVSNLVRLGLVLQRYDIFPVAPHFDEREKQVREHLTKLYGSKLNDPDFAKNLKIPLSIDVRKLGLYLTPLGDDFCEICLNDQTMGTTPREET